MSDKIVKDYMTAKVKFDVAKTVFEENPSADNLMATFDAHDDAIELKAKLRKAAAKTEEKAENKKIDMETIKRLYGKPIDA